MTYFDLVTLSPFLAATLILRNRLGWKCTLHLESRHTSSHDYDCDNHMTTFVRKFDYRICPTIGAIDVSISQIPTIARIGGGGVA